MPTYESCFKNLTELNSVLQLPNSNIFSINLIKDHKYEATLVIEFIVYQGVFYPVTERGYIHFNKDGTYKTVLPNHKDILAMSLEKRITDILVQV